MISWKNMHHIIFNFDVLLDETVANSIRLTKTAEKLLFFILNQNPGCKLHIVSNKPLDDLEKKVKQLGLDCLISNAVSSLSSGLVIANPIFWGDFLSKNQIDTEKTVVFETEPHNALSAASQNIKVVLLTNNECFDTYQFGDRDIQAELLKYKSNISFIKSINELLPEDKIIAEVLNA